MKNVYLLFLLILTFSTISFAPAPSITLKYPANDTLLTGKQFVIYSFTADTNTATCELHLNDTANGLDFVYENVSSNNNTDIFRNITQDLSGGTYRWFIRCTDTTLPTALQNSSVVQIFRIAEDIDLLPLILGLLAIMAVSIYIALNIGQGKRHEFLSFIFLALATLSIPVVLFTITKGLDVLNGLDTGQTLAVFYSNFFVGTLVIPLLIVVYFLYLMFLPLVIKKDDEDNEGDIPPFIYRRPKG